MEFVRSADLLTCALSDTMKDESAQSQDQRRNAPKKGSPGIVYVSSQ